MTETGQQTLTEFVDPTATHTEEITRTVVCPLETSRRKSGRVREAVESWQEIAARVATLMKSHQPSQWRSNATVTYQALTREFPDKNGLMASTAQQAGEKVAEAYDSWDANGRPSDQHPQGQFGDGAYLRLRHDDIELVRHESDDETDQAIGKTGYGVKVKLEPYDPEWFGLVAGDYQQEYLDSVLDEDTPTRHGSAELHIDNDGSLVLHLTVTDEIETYDVGEVPRTVGIDIGENVIYAAAVIDRETAEPIQVKSKPGHEFRHHRDRLSERIARASQQGKLRAVKLRRERRRYTDQMLHVAATELVDLAVDHLPCCIVLEDLTGLRTTVEDPIHDWAYADLHEKVSYKATARGIPVETVDPSGTSTTCRKCGYSNDQNRTGTEFLCLQCSYAPPHADEHAAINIATEYDDTTQ